MNFAVTALQFEFRCGIADLQPFIRRAGTMLDAEEEDGHKQERGESLHDQSVL
jgi:hypothetical protein